MFADALRYEWTRLRTVRSTYVLVFGAILANLVLPIVLTATGVNTVQSSADGAGMVVGGVGTVPELFPIPAAMLGILGAFSMGHEYRHGTLQPTLLAIPKRSVLVAAKAVMAASIGGATALASMMLNTMCVFFIVGQPVPLHGQQGALLGFVALMAGWAVLGLALGLVFRQSLAAVVFLFAVPLVGETLIRLLLTQVEAFAEHAHVVRYFPFAAGNALAHAVGADRLDFGTPLSRVEYAALFGGMVVALLGYGWHRFVVKDA